MDSSKVRNREGWTYSLEKTKTVALDAVTIKFEVVATM